MKNPPPEMWIQETRLRFTINNSKNLSHHPKIAYGTRPGMTMSKVTEDAGCGPYLYIMTVENAATQPLSINFVDHSIPIPN